jgi:hypothetical protein
VASLRCALRDPKAIVAFLLAAAVAETVLLGIDSGLRRLERAGAPSYGMPDLAAVAGGHASRNAQGAIATWQSAATVGAPSYTTWGHWYLAIDTLLLVPAYLLALRAVARRLKAPVSWIWAVLVAELVENGAQLLLLHADPEDWGRGYDLVAWAGALAGAARWLLLAIGVVVILLRWLDNRAGPARPLTLEAAREVVRERRSAWAPLRAPLVLVVLAAVVLVLPASDQPPDVLRRWLDREAADRLRALAGLAMVAAFAFAVWLAGRRLSDLPMIEEPDERAGDPRLRESQAPAVVLAAAVAVVLLGVLPELLGSSGWWRLLALAAILAVVAILTLLAGVKPFQREGPPKGWWRVWPDRERVRHNSRLLSAAVVAIVGLACVRAFAPPVFLISKDVDPSTWRWNLAGLLGGALLATAGALGWHALLRSLDRASGDGHKLWRVVAGLLVGGVVLVAFCWPGQDGLPRTLTAAGVLMLAFAIMTLLAGELGRWVETGVPARPFRLVGLTRTPAFALVGVWFLLATPFDTGGFHDVRVVPPDPAERDPAFARTTVQRAFADWRAQAGCPSGDVERPARPLLLVAASGGGIRAAYWTRTVLDDLTRHPCSEAALFAASGISGSSLGLVSYASSRDTGGGPLAQDHLAPTLASLLFVDLPRSLVGFDAADRAERLERSWEGADPSVSEDFDDLEDVPLLLLNGATVESGCRFSVAAVELGAEPRGEKGVDCRSLDQYLARSSPAAGTVDLQDFLCAGQHVRRSTAALLSARFPLVSPAGRLEECDHPDREARVTYVVDGGYIENTGAGAILDLWRALEPSVRRRQAGGECIVPLFVQIENGYERLATSPPAGRPPEFTVPLRAYLEAGAEREWIVSAQAKLAFGDRRYFRLAPTRRPGVQAPLGWVLSGTAQRDLDDQRQRLQRAEKHSDWPALERLLSGQVPCDAS